MFAVLLPVSASCLVILGRYQLQSLWGIPGAPVTILSRSTQAFLWL